MQMIPFTKQTALTDYYPLPRQVLGLNLPSTAVMLYAVLLDRATLSRKNEWTDDDGHIYVVYTIEHLAETLRTSETAVKRHLTELEQNGLIDRRRPVGNGPSHIFLNIPQESFCTDGQARNAPSDGTKARPPTAQKVTVNNLRKQELINNYSYQHGEDESL